MNGLLALYNNGVLFLNIETLEEVFGLSLWLKPIWGSPKGGIRVLFKHYLWLNK